VVARGTEDRVVESYGADTTLKILMQRTIIIETGHGLFKARGGWG